MKKTSLALFGILLLLCLPNLAFSVEYGQVFEGFDDYSGLASYDANCTVSDGALKLSRADYSPYNTSGLVLWLHMDEGEGTTAYDSSGYGNNGTVYGANWTDGKYGNALSFDGVDDKVDCGVILPDLTVFTLVAWIKPAVVSGHQDIVAQGPGGNGGGWELKIANDRVVVGASFTDAWREMVVSGVILAGEWRMVVGVWNGTYFHVYVNGELKRQSEDLSAYTRKLSTSKVWIGAWGGCANFFNGIIDEVRIYNRALTEQEIAYDYNNGKLYRTTTQAESIDVLGGARGVVEPYTVTVNANVPENCTAQIQFSLDGVSWFDSFGRADYWNTLSNGNTTINLTPLGYETEHFYYRLRLLSNGDDTPKIDYLIFQYKEEESVTVTVETPIAWFHDPVKLGVIAVGIFIAIFVFYELYKMAR